MQKIYTQKKNKQYNFNDIKNKHKSQKKAQYLGTFPLASIGYSYMANVKNIKKYYNNFNM